FRVRMAYRVGDWLDNERPLTVVVPAKYYQTVGFQALVGFLSLGLLVLLVALIFKRNQLAVVVRQKHRFLEEARAEKEMISAQNAQLQQAIGEYNAKIQQLSQRNASFREQLQTTYQQLVQAQQHPKDAPWQTLQEDVAARLQDLEEEPPLESLPLQPDDFLLRFAQAYPKLTANDLRICNLIRQNLANKEIAEALNITPGSLEQSRYRIRKKMGLSSKDNLNDLILRF
ncbi:MAG TPA: hypothetical protein DCP28_23520, partial [Cytophagales bacterium]|nr:hypothetical protein [Cytophagales bacterium]